MRLKQYTQRHHYHNIDLNLQYYSLIKYDNGSETETGIWNKSYSGKDDNKAQQSSSLPHSLLPNQITIKPSYRVYFSLNVVCCIVHATKCSKNIIPFQSFLLTNSTLTIMRRPFNNRGVKRDWNYVETVPIFNDINRPLSFSNHITLMSISVYIKLSGM